MLLTIIEYVAIFASSYRKHPYAKGIKGCRENDKKKLVTIHFFNNVKYLGRSWVQSAARWFWSLPLSSRR